MGRKTSGKSSTGFRGSHRHLGNPAADLTGHGAEAEKRILAGKADLGQLIDQGSFRAPQSMELLAPPRISPDGVDSPTFSGALSVLHGRRLDPTPDRTAVFLCLSGEQLTEPVEKPRSQLS